AGGALLSLLFLLTVSWHSRPYYYGADVVFLAAWLPLLFAGDGDVLSLDARLRRRTERQLRIAPSGAVSVEFATIRGMCGAYDQGRCQLRKRQACDPAPCPVLRAGSEPPPELASEL